MIFSKSKISKINQIKLIYAERKAVGIVNKWAATATAVSWIPGSNFAFSVADYAMIEGVAKAFRVENFQKEAVVSAVGSGATGKTLLLELLSFIPGPGWAIKAAVSGSMAKGLGESVIAYFKKRSPYNGDQLIPDLEEDKARIRANIEAERLRVEAEQAKLEKSETPTVSSESVEVVK